MDHPHLVTAVFQSAIRFNIEALDGLVGDEAVFCCFLPYHALQLNWEMRKGMECWPLTSNSLRLPWICFGLLLRFRSLCQSSGARPGDSHAIGFEDGDKDRCLRMCSASRSMKHEELDNGQLWRQAGQCMYSVVQSVIPVLVVRGLLFAQKPLLEHSVTLGAE